MSHQQCSAGMTSKRTDSGVSKGNARPNVHGSRTDSTQATPRLLTDECINKTWNMHVMEYYSALKRQGILSHDTNWMKLEDILPNEDQSVTDTLSVILLLWHSCMCVLSRFSCVQLFVTLWTTAWQVPLSMGFSRQENWSGLPCPPPGESSRPRD